MSSTEILSQAHEELIARLGYIQIQPKNVLLVGNFSELEIQTIAKIYAKAKIYRSLNLELNLEKFEKLEVLDLSDVSGVSAKKPEILNSSLAFFDVILGAEINPEKLVFEKIFQRFSVLLKPEGMLLFTLKGPDFEANQEKNYSAYPDMHDIGDLLLQLRFEDPVVDSEFGLTFGHAWGVKPPKQIQDKNPDGSLKAIRVSLDNLIASLKKPFQ